MADFRDQIQSSIGPAYTILRELGGGGMSRVFAARDVALGRDIVIKVVSPDLAQTISAERFAREIRLAASLQEPHIVPLFAAGETSDGLPYYTMPFVRGESLRSRLDSGKIPRAEALEILRDMARALEYAHRNGVVHRDIKPENVLLSSGTAMVTDFGIAKAVRAARDDHRRTLGDRTLGSTTSPLTSIGLSLGTPAYMSPEQGVGVDEVDHRADLYSWGVVAWEMLAGKHPFANRTTAQSLVAAHVSEPAPPLSSATSGVSTPLTRLVMRCLAKDPASRPQSAAELLAVLARPSVTESTGQRRLAVLAGSSLLMAAAVVGVLMWRGAAGDSPASPRSVGVTTFVNLGADSSTEYFSEGVTQEIADALGRVPGLRVAIRHPGPGGGGTSGADVDARTLGRAMRVETVLTGSVQRAGDRVRVTARLVNTEDGFQIWAGKFDREISDVFALQDEVARAIVGSLELTLAPGARDSLVRVATTDAEAHNLYLRGMYFWNRRGSQNIYKSMTYFQRAIERDPGFARAWAGLALAYAIVITWDDVDVPPMLDHAFDAARRALALDSTTSDAWTAIAEANQALWKNSEATDAFVRAITLDPNNATAHQWYAEHLAHLGQFEQALTRIHVAQQLAPLSPVVNTQEGRIELQARHFPQAKKALEYVLELDSTYRTAHALLGAVYLQLREFDKAIASFHRAIQFSAARRTVDVAFLAHAYATAGRTAEAQRLLAELEQRRASGGTVSYAGLALVYQSLGAGDRAIALLDTAVSKYDSVVQMQSREAIFDPFRADPRGAAILARSEALTPAK